LELKSAGLDCAIEDGAQAAEVEEERRVWSFVGLPIID
jgi:hypothetical protein